MIQRALPVEEICRRLKPFLGSKVDEIYLKYSVAETREEREDVTRAISILYHKYLDKSLLDEAILLEPSDVDLSTNYPLGEIYYADKTFGGFGLREKDWPRHVCVTGMSGSGKTTFAFTILHNFMKNNKPFMVFDWKKSFRPLMADDKSILCYTVGNPKVANLFRVNINRPPEGVGPKEWLGILCDLIVESFFASYGVHKVFREVMDQAFKDFGVYGGSDNYPTWRQLKDRLEAKANERGGSRREAEWIESALRIADSLTFGSFGDAVCSKDPFGLTVDDLLDKRILLELHSLGNAEKKFFCEYILSYIYFKKKFNDSEEGSVFKSAIMVDEAHHIFLKDKPNFVKESITEIVYRELREYGISLVCLDQHMSKISEVVSGNSATNIAFQQMLPDDVYANSGLMQIRDNQKYYANLQVGEAIVKLAERYTEPFMIKVPFVDTKAAQIKDEDIKELMEKKMKEFRGQKKIEFSMDEKNISKAMEKAAKLYLKGGVTIDITPEHRKFMDILRKGEMNTTIAYRELALSARKCNTLKQDLIGQNLITSTEKKSPQGIRRVLQLTEKGLEFIRGKKGLKQESKK